MIGTEILQTSAWRPPLVQLQKEHSFSEVSPTAGSFRHSFRAAIFGGVYSRVVDSVKGRSNLVLRKQQDKWSAHWQTRPSKQRTSAKILTTSVLDASQCLESGVAAETIDVVTLGNLCVDIVKHVEELPPTDKPRRRAYMDAMVARPPPETQWEGGGNCNTAIAAARLGLRCTALGHIGDEVFGDFLRRILASEGVGFQEVQESGQTPLGGEDYDGETLLCWVIIHPTDGHTFCSRFDFDKGPAFSRLTELPPAFGRLMSRSRAVFCNGFVYDELPPPTVHAALRKAREHGAAVFFDPGPRGEAFCKASEYKRECVETLMRLSDVVLMTAEEAETITGLRDQEAAAEALLNRGGAIQWVVIKDGGRGCHMTTHEGSFWLPAYRIDVADTVGCGDSFAAAVVLGFIRGEGAVKSAISIQADSFRLDLNRSVVEGPITTLALANAVGAATAMGIGAGRNVAQSDVLASILSDTDRQQGVVTVRLKSDARLNENGASSSGESGKGMYEDEGRAGVSRGSRKLLSTSNGALLGESATDLREGSAAETNAGPGETSQNGKRKHASEVDESHASLPEEGAPLLLSGGGVCGRLSPLGEIKKLQLLSGGHVEMVDGECQVFKVNFQIAARAAAALFENSKQGQAVQLYK